jgi:drug/metabolite transporter (DMT)-like permease
MSPNSQRQSSLDTIGIIGAITTASGWGMAGIFIQLVPNFSALSIVAIRLSLALVFIVLILLLFQNNSLIHINELRRATTWGFSWIMLACYTFGTIAFQMAYVGEVTLLMATAPIFVILFKFLLREQVEPNDYRGAFIAFIGICFVIFPSLIVDGMISKQRIIGNFLALLVSILFAIYAIWFSSLSQQDNAPSSINIALGTFILGCSTFFSTILRSLSAYNNSANIKYLIAFLGLGIVSTVIPTLSYATAARRLPPLITTSILLLEPIFAMVFAFIVLGEVPSIWIIPGTICIVTGILFMR